MVAAEDRGIGAAVREPHPPAAVFVGGAAMTSVEIQVYRGEELVEVQRFEEEVIKIGRLPSAHLRLVDPEVARVHAVLEIVGERVHVIVADPLAATRVRGRAIVGEVCLGGGAPLEIGPFRVEVELCGALAPAVVTTRDEVVAPEGALRPLSASVGAEAPSLAASGSGWSLATEPARATGGATRVGILLLALLCALAAALLALDAGGREWQRCADALAMASWSCPIRHSWTPPSRALALLLAALAALTLGLRRGPRRAHVSSRVREREALWSPLLAESGC